MKSLEEIHMMFSRRNMTVAEYDSAMDDFGKTLGTLRATVLTMKRARLDMLDDIINEVIDLVHTK